MLYQILTTNNDGQLQEHVLCADDEPMLYAWAYKKQLVIETIKPLEVVPCNY